MNRTLEKIRTKSFGEIVYCIVRIVLGRKGCEAISLSFFRLCKRLPLRQDVLMFRTEGDFCDNGRALYEYLEKRKDKRRKFVWAVNNPKRFANSKNTIFLSPYKGFRFRYFYYLAVAKNILETHNLTQIKRREGQNYISLWHGTAMKLRKLSGEEKPEIVFNYLLSCSRSTISNQARFLDCDESLVVPLGFPRNDLLLINKSEGINNPLAEGGNYSKVVIWMPTFRASINEFLSEKAVDTDTGLPLLEHVSDLGDISQFLKTQNVLMIVKIHHLQAKKEVFKMKFDNLLFVQDEDLLQQDIQLYEMMAKTDALLTDYSSVFVDYLLLDKPMGFIINDFSGYQKSRGVPFDNYFEMVPGQLINTKDDLMRFIKSVVAGEDEYKSKRDMIVPMFHDHVDAKSCERVSAFFGL